MASRPKRAPPVELPPLTLSMFPPHRSLVLTPRTNGEPTWCMVLGHKAEKGAAPMLRVHPDGDDAASFITLAQVRSLQCKGCRVVELIEDTPPRAPGKKFKAEGSGMPIRVVHTEMKVPKVEAKVEVKAEVKAEAKAEAKVKAEVKAEAGAGVEAEAKAEVAAEAKPALHEPIRAKLEYVQKSGPSSPSPAKDPETLAREALRAKLQTTPDGAPRAVFRAGCHARCLTQVLGGVGTDDVRRVNEDHILNDGHVLIRRGNFYLWGLADWNPWAPSFAGDSGLYIYWDLAAELKRTGQKSFHLFRHCTDNPLKMPPSAWHGRDAAKKALYLGEYTVDEDCTQEMRYNDLAPVYTATQDLMIDYALRRGQHGTSAEQIRDHFERENRTFTMQVVVPVGYDERLYEELVRCGANNGVVETDVDKLGRL